MIWESFPYVGVISRKMKYVQLAFLSQSLFIQFYYKLVGSPWINSRVCSSFLYCILCFRTTTFLMCTDKYRDVCTYKTNRQHSDTFKKVTTLSTGLFYTYDTLTSGQNIICAGAVGTRLKELVIGWFLLISVNQVHRYIFK